MKAYVLHDINDIRLEIVDDPAPAADEVVVRVKACGICGSDIPRIYKTGAHNMPLIPGHEFSGIVEEVGADADRHWIGKRVGVFPLMPCMACGPCSKRHYEMCRNYDYLGSRSNGAYAEYVTVPQWNLIELPDSISYESAAMLEPMCVAMHAIRRIDIDRSKSIAVCGLGTIGQLVIMLLANGMGADIKRIYAIGTGRAQRDRAMATGLLQGNFCNGRETDATRWLMDKTGGVDVYFECVGKNETLLQGINGAAPGGRIVAVGNPASDMLMDRNIYWKILRDQLTITGTWNSSFDHAEDDDWNQVVELIDSGIILPERLITHKLGLDDLITGLHIMRDKTEDFCKIMMVA